jgi:hypothetical protein
MQLVSSEAACLQLVSVLRDYPEEVARLMTFAAHPRKADKSLPCIEALPATSDVPCRYFFQYQKYDA